MASTHFLSPTAEQLFVQLISDSDTSAKLKSTLNMVKKTCNLITAAQGVMTFSTISSVGTKHFGGPAYSTIANKNAKARPYILLRIKEYQATKKSTDTQKLSSEQRSIDINNMDPLTRRMVQDLLQRNQLLQGMMEDLKKRAILDTRQVAHNTAQAIGMGVDPSTGALPYPDKNIKRTYHPANESINGVESFECPIEVVHIARRMLKLVDSHDPDKRQATVNWETYDDKYYLRAETEVEEITLITEIELPILVSWLENLRGD